MEPSVVFYQVHPMPVVYFSKPIICRSLGKWLILTADIKAVKTSWLIWLCLTIDLFLSVSLSLVSLSSLPSPLSSPLSPLSLISCKTQTTQATRNSIAVLISVLSAEETLRSLFKTLPSGILPPWSRRWIFRRLSRGSSALFEVHSFPPLCIYTSS